LSLESLAHYKILDKIGAGGMGEVYRARDTRLGRTVAIKVLPADVAVDSARRDRFLREARASAALSHPNIAALYEIGEDQGHLFLALEFVPGQPLSAAIGGRPMNPRRAVHLAVQIADALADAHAAGIVHRDIKPANIIVTPKGNAKILDFGLATWTAGGAERQHAVADAATVMATGPGTTLGTVAYMSPEQALGQRVDERTDIFSLGIVLFEMLTGRLPFTGSTSTALALQIVQAPTPLPTALNRSLPPEVDAIVAKALAKSLDQRYESAATMAAELRSVAAILEVRAEAHASESASVPLPTRPRRRSGGGWLVVLLLLAALAALAWWFRDPIERLWRRALGPSPPPVIAVIPLELAATDASQTYFADGLTEDLMTRLGQTPGLKVLGRSATRDYRGRPPRDVATDLGAGVVLTGSLRPSADAITISLVLIDPRDGTAIWSNQYTREIKDVFAVQAQVAEEVAQALRVKRQPTPSSARAASRLVDRRAYDLYMHGRHATAERRLTEAIDAYQQAIAADAGLAEAHAGLAEAIQIEGLFSGAADDPRRRARLKAAADRASELDPDLPQANLAAALAADRLADALGFLKKAITRDPTYSEGYHQIGDQILDFDPARAIQFYRRALALDPRMDVNHGDIVSALLAQGRYDEAQKEIDSVPDSTAATWKMPLRLAVALDRRQYDAALALLRQGTLMRDVPMFALNEVAALRMAGDRDQAYKEAARLVNKTPDSCEAKAALAGLKQERGEAAAARQLVAPALQAAALPDVLPSSLRCGALSAAAVGDASRTAAFLRRIAEDERMLRAWAVEITGTTGSTSLRRGMFPWTHVHDRPEVAAARARLDEAYRREREVATAALEGLP
jgi:non-specific serine/threonine protein kinase